MDLYLNYLGGNPYNFLDPTVIGAISLAHSLKVDITVNEAREWMKAKGPHPDAWMGNYPDRGKMYIWEDDIILDSDFVMPDNVQQLYGITALVANASSAPAQ